MRKRQTKPELVGRFFSCRQSQKSHRQIGSNAKENTNYLFSGHKSIATLEIYLKHNNKNALTGVIEKVKALEGIFVF